MQIFGVFKTALKDIADIVCPEVCLGCGERFSSDSEHLICTSCLMDLTKTDFYKNDVNPITQEFAIFQHSIDYGCCYLQFKKNDITQSLLHNIKYYNHPELGFKLGRMAALELKKYHRFEKVDYILPVPMHPAKQKKRGFNQAERIAAGMSSVLGIPICEDILHKTVNSVSQTFMDKEMRYQNAMKIFSATRADDKANCHFLIVDDVFTTGSTLMICLHKLKEAMPECTASIFALAHA